LNIGIISKILRLDKALNFINISEKKITITYHISTSLMEYIFSKTSEKLPKTALHICTTQIVRVIQMSDKGLHHLLKSMKNDAMTHNHSVNVAFLASLVGKELRYSPQQMFELTYAALLHDIGKIRVEIKILEKQKISYYSEFQLMKQHPEYSCSILQNNGIINHHILNAVLQHHERLDGTGYPKRLEKNEINEYARIIHVCDIFDTLTNTSFGDRFTCYETFMIVKGELLHTIDYRFINILIRLMHSH